MVTSVRIPQLVAIDPEFGKAKKRREQLQARKDELIAEGIEKAGTSEPEVPKAARRGELERIGAELADLGRFYHELGRKAGQKAGRQLATDASFCKLTLEAVGSWAVAYGDWLALAQTVTKARGAGVDALPLPSSIMAEIGEMKLWLSAAIRRGSVNVDELPVPLRALVGEGR
ncbi:MAG: hypothetical protein ABSB57_03225 [Dehalococcoidia bacterium]